MYDFPQDGMLIYRYKLNSIPQLREYTYFSSCHVTFHPSRHSTICIAIIRTCPRHWKEKVIMRLFEDWKLWSCAGNDMLPLEEVQSSWHTNPSFYRCRQILRTQYNVLTTTYLLLLEHKIRSDGIVVSA
jgi:hypothetical protein